MIGRMVLAAGVCAVAGCSNFGEVPDPERSKQFTGIDMHSAYPVTRRLYFERINLLELVDPEMKAREAFKVAWNAAEENAKKSPNAEEESINKYGAWYDLALA